MLEICRRRVGCVVTANLHKKWATGRIAGGLPPTPEASACRGPTRQLLWRERLRGSQESIAHRMMRGEQDAHAASIADDGSAGLEQLDADGGRRGASQFGIGQGNGAQAVHERVGQGGEHHAQPVGQKSVAAGTGTKEVELGFLDPVLRFAALAVQIVVELVGRQAEVGDHETGFVALCAEFEAHDDAPLPIPRVRGIGEFRYLPLLRSGLGIALFKQPFPVFDDSLKPGISGDTDHIADIPALAPADQPLAAEAGIAADDDADFRSCRAAGSPVA